MNVIIYSLLTILPYVSLSYIAGTSPGNYTYAVEYCESLGTSIASIHSAAQFEQAQQSCQQTVIANSGQSGCYIGLKMDNLTKIWSWEDGSPIDYGFYSNNNATTGILPWNTNEPSSVKTGKEPCVHIWQSNGYKYNDRGCHAIKDFPLCNDIPMEYTAGSSKGNYTYAVNYCESIGLSIASIHTWQDYQNAKTECQRTVTTNFGTSGCYIGLTMDNSTKIWSWEDGSDIDYGFDAANDPATGVLPWNTNEPNSVSSGREPCVNLWKSSGYKYNDRTCYENPNKEFPLCNNPVVPTSQPSFDPTTDPTNDPTVYPTTSVPTRNPSMDPSVGPTHDPTIDPTMDPTADPSIDPTFDPTIDPSMDPTENPIIEATSDPTNVPTKDPTIGPTPDPTAAPFVSGEQIFVDDSNDGNNGDGAAEEETTTTKVREAAGADDDDDIESNPFDYQTVTYIIGVVLVLIVFLSWIDARFIRINDFHQTGLLVSVVIDLMDYISDIVFALHLLSYHYDSLYIVGFLGVGFVVLPLIISLIQLHLQFSYWQRFDDINAYISENAKLLYGISIIVGNSFTAICLVHSRLFDCYKLDIPLNKLQLLEFKNKRIYSVVFFENIPQILLQIGYIILLPSADRSSIVYASMAFSVLSVFITVLSIRTYGNIVNSRDYVHVEIDVKGLPVINKMNKCKNRVRELRHQFSCIYGIGIKSLEIERPTQIPHGLRVSMNVYIGNTAAIDINCYKLLSEGIKSGQVNEIIKQCWQLSGVPTVTNLRCKQHQSKNRKDNTVSIKHESEMAEFPMNNKNGALHANVISLASDSSFQPGEKEDNDNYLPPLPPQNIQTMGGDEDDDEGTDTDQGEENDQVVIVTNGGVSKEDDNDNLPPRVPPVVVTAIGDGDGDSDSDNSTRKEFMNNDTNSMAGNDISQAMHKYTSPHDGQFRD